MNVAKAIFDPSRHSVYNPKFPNKYSGEYPIIAKSKWETAFMRWCDFNPSVLKWSSETLVIQYYNPLKKKWCRYFPDFVMEVQEKTGNVKVKIVEIKPFKEVYPRPKSGKSIKSVMYENHMYIQNLAKWNAAQDFCKKRGYDFVIITEKELFS